jgi:hypothetical protein
VNASTGANITPALVTTSTDANGNFSATITPDARPIRITVSGGKYSSEMNSSTITSPSEVTLLLMNGSSNQSNLSVNPLSTFVDSRVVGILAGGGGVPFNTALLHGTALVENIYGLSTDPGTLTPVYDSTGSDAANLGLILGAIVNEDQNLCPASPGGLVTALASDIADGSFNGKGSNGSAVGYCGEKLPAIAGITDFQDALSGLNQLQNVTAGFAFGGSGNSLTANGLANVAQNGTEVYPTTALNTINEAIASAAPTAVNTFAPGGGPTMTAARELATATLLPNGQVLIAGGIASGPAGSSPTNRAELYDPINKTFSATAHTMTAARYGHTATLLANGQVLIVGGSADNTTASATAELYDPSNGTFTATTGTMGFPRAFHTATLLASGQVLIAGGSKLLVTGGPDFKNGLLNNAEIYTPGQGTFAPTANSMSNNRAGATATLLPNGEVLIAGGDNAISDGPGGTRTADLYNPNTEKFTATTGTMTDQREFASAVLLPNGEVLIAGGTPGQNQAAESSAELYNPGNGTFTLISNPMNSPRAFQTATLLPNGNVLIAGGALGSAGGGLPTFNSLSSAELYAPGPQTFTAIGNGMTAVRTLMSATLLPNSQVLIDGGQDNTNNPEKTIDLYTP